MRRTRKTYTRHTTRRKTKNIGNFSTLFLGLFVGYFIGIKYPESFDKVQEIVKTKAGNKASLLENKKLDNGKKILPENNKKNDIIKLPQLEQKPVKIEANTFQVRFSPNGGCLDFAKGFIDRAKNCILVQGYSFTSELIAKALVEAHKRGVKVMILLDKSQPTAVGSQIYFVKNNGIPVAIDYVSGIAHNKIMIIDDKIVLTGSFNWTMGAEKRNAENLLMINNAEIAKIYKGNWMNRSRNAIKFLENNRNSYEKNVMIYKKGKIPAKQAEYEMEE